MSGAPKLLLSLLLTRRTGTYRYCEAKIQTVQYSAPSRRALLCTFCMTPSQLPRNQRPSFTTERFCRSLPFVAPPSCEVTRKQTNERNHWRL